jgi:hypothetical protein
MNMHALTKKRSILVIAIIAILAVSSFAVFQGNKGAQAAVVDPHPGLVGWWRFDEGSGTAANDASGYGNNGAINGVTTWGTGMHEGALSFDGSSTYVSVPSASSLFPSSAITIEFWVKIASANINSNAYMGFVSTSTRTNGLQIIKNWGSGHVLFETPGVGGLISNVALTPDVWNLVTCVLVSGSSATIYINGQQHGSSSGWVLPATVMEHWIGRAAQGTSNPYLNGALDEARIYNRALSSTEIQVDYSQSPDLSSNVMAKVPQGATQVIATLSWQGTGSITATITSPSHTYTESEMSVYQKTSYSTSGGSSGMLNIKRLSISPAALSSDENWYIALTFDSVSTYQISVEVQK